MPAKIVIKSYVPHGIYHIYNRGVNKGSIFFDEQDYRVFLSYLSEGLIPKNEKLLREISVDESRSYKDRREAARRLRLKNFTGKIELLAYCLMPNHFHFLLRQKEEGDMSAFIQALMTRFTMYENRRHKRIGRVFQGPYKAVLVGTDAQLLHVSRYIHRNPFSLKRPRLFRLVPSSYPNYLGEIFQEWVKPKEILSYFPKARTGFLSYQAFVEMQNGDFEEQSMKLIREKSIDLA
mgnify:CR=1 FL=1